MYNKPVRAMHYLLSFLIGLLIAVNPAYGQIVYTDIDPDTTIVAADDSWGMYSIDMNRDGTDDILLNHHNTLVSSNYQKIEVGIRNNYTEILCDGTAGHYPLAMLHGQAIQSSSGEWYNPTSWMIHLNGNGTEGHWIGVTDTYLAVRVGTGGQWYYGWIRLDIPANAGSYTVKDFAYESEANRAIAAGDKTVNGIEDVAVTSEYKIYPNPGNGVFFLKFDGNVHSLEIYNVLGEIIATASQERRQSGNIDLSQSPPGIYLVNIHDGVKVTPKKIVKR